MHQKWSLVDWDTLCTPKRAGGLGLRDPEAVNKVMGDKIWWKWVMYREEPWALLWHKKYTVRWYKQNLIRFVEDSLGSHIWKASKKNKQLSQKHSFWEVRDGASTSFIQDAWQQLPRLEDRGDVEDLQRRLTTNLLEKVQDVWDPKSSTTQFRTWKPKQWWQAQASRVGLEDFYEHLQDKLIPIEEGPDKFRWG